MVKTPTIKHQTTQGGLIKTLKAERVFKKAIYSQRHVELTIEAPEEVLSKLLAYIALTKESENKNMQTQGFTKLKGVRKLSF